MDWQSGVAMQLVLLCRNEDGGRLQRDGFIEASLRAALLVDLVLAGRIKSGGGGYWTDVQATGFPPADLLLARIQDEPERSVEWWIARGPVIQEVLALEWVRSRGWQLCRTGLFRRPRYLPGLDHEPPNRAALLERLEAGSVGWQLSETDAALTVLAATAEIDGARDGPPTPLLLRACGRARWLVEAADAFVAADRARLEDAYIVKGGAVGG